MRSLQAVWPDRSDHFALLSETQTSLDCSSGLGQDRLVRATTTASDGSATTMEQQQAHVLLACHSDQFALCDIQRPVRGDIASIFVAIRVAQHDLLLVAA